MSIIPLTLFIPVNLSSDKKMKLFLNFVVIMIIGINKTTFSSESLILIIPLNPNSDKKIPLILNWD